MQPGQSPSDSPLLTSFEWAASVRVADLLPEVPSVGTYRRPQVAAVCDFVCVFFQFPSGLIERSNGLIY